METGELRYYHSSQNNFRFVDVPHLIRTGGRCHLMQGKVVPVLDTVAGHFLCPNGLPMLYIQGSGLGVVR
jgi:hypothetical protein